jgi:hypothetical protein
MTISASESPEEVSKKIDKKMQLLANQGECALGIEKYIVEH